MYNILYSRIFSISQYIHTTMCTHYSSTHSVMSSSEQRWLTTVIRHGGATVTVTHIATITTLKHVSLSYQYLMLTKRTFFECVCFSAAFKLMRMSELLLQRHWEFALWRCECEARVYVLYMQRNRRRAMSSVWVSTLIRTAIVVRLCRDWPWAEKNLFSGKIWTENIIYTCMIKIHVHNNYRITDSQENTGQMSFVANHPITLSMSYAPYWEHSPCLNINK